MLVITKKICSHLSTSVVVAPLTLESIVSKSALRPTTRAEQYSCIMSLTDWQNRYVCVCLMHYHPGKIPLCLSLASWPHCLCHALLLPPLRPVGFVLAALGVWCVGGPGLHQGVDCSTLILLTGPNPPWDNAIPEGSWLKPLFLALRYIKRRQLESREQSTLETFFAFHPHSALSILPRLPFLTCWSLSCAGTSAKLSQAKPS